MRGKVGLVIGLAAGYVLGSRAGRERYEQIREQSQKVWNLPPVQKQVQKVKDTGKSAAMALPRALWSGVAKVVGADTTPEPRRGSASAHTDDASVTAGAAGEASARPADAARDRDRS